MINRSYDSNFPRFEKHQHAAQRKRISNQKLPLGTPPNGIPFLSQWPLERLRATGDPGCKSERSRRQVQEPRRAGHCRTIRTTEHSGKTSRCFPHFEKHSWRRPTSPTNLSQKDVSWPPLYVYWTMDSFLPLKIRLIVPENMWTCSTDIQDSEFGQEFLQKWRENVSV